MAYSLNTERAENILSLVLVSLKFTIIGRHRGCENEPNRCARLIDLGEIEPITNVLSVTTFTSVSSEDSLTSESAKKIKLLRRHYHQARPCKPVTSYFEQ